MLAWSPLVYAGFHATGVLNNKIRLKIGPKQADLTVFALRPMGCMRSLRTMVTLTESQLTSSFRVTTVRAVGSRLDADSTSLSCASFFSSVSARAPSFFSNKRFLKLLFCCTSWIALTNFRYNSSRSFCICEDEGEILVIKTGGISVNICDVIKQIEPELANTVFKIQPNKANSFFCFFYCLFNPLTGCIFGTNYPISVGFSPN